MARQRRAGEGVEDAGPDVERAAEGGRIAEPPAEGWDGPRAVRYTMPLKLSAPDNDLDDPDLPYWLALNRVRGIGPARFRALLDAFGTAEAAWCGTVAGWRAAGLDTRTASAFERQRHTIVPEAELERLGDLSPCLKAGGSSAAHRGPDRLTPRWKAVDRRHEPLEPWCP